MTDEDSHEVDEEGERVPNEVPVAHFSSVDNQLRIENYVACEYNQTSIKQNISGNRGVEEQVEEANHAEGAKEGTKEGPGVEGGAVLGVDGAKGEAGEDANSAHKCGRDNTGVNVSDVVDERGKRYTLQESEAHQVGESTVNLVDRRTLDQKDQANHANEGNEATEGEVAM